MPKPIERTDRLIEAIDILRETADFLELAANGELSLTQVAEKMNITPHKLSKKLEKRFRSMAAQIVTEKRINEILLLAETPAQKLVKGILGLDLHIPAEIPDFSEDTLWDTAYEILSRREYDVICLRFGNTADGHMQTLDEIAKKWSLSKEAVRMIESKGLRKLRHPKALSTIFPVRFSEATPMLEERVSIVTKEYEALYKEYDNKLSAMNKLKSSSEEYDDTFDIDYFDTPASLISIEKLGLPVRPYNCLKRRGLENVQDIIDIKVEQLIQIEHMGKNSVLSIIDTLSVLEAVPEEWKESARKYRQKIA